MKKILETLKTTDYQKNVKTLLNSNFCSHKLRIEFAIYCINDYLSTLNPELYHEDYKKIKVCLELIEKWLIEPKKITKKELQEAADKAIHVRHIPNWSIVYAANYAASNKLTEDAHAIYTSYYTTHEFNIQKKHYEWLFNRLTEDMNKETIEILYGELK